MITKIKDRLSQYFAKKAIEKHGTEIVSPLAAIQKPRSEWKVAFLTTAGIHLKEEKKFNVKAGDWSVRFIPSSSQHADLTVSHTHYNTKNAQEDVNTVFPIEALQELSRKGAIGTLAPTFIGMMGYIPRTRKLLKESVPIILKQLKEEEVDVLLLSPG
ncbi:glycine/sarcosine/betaine reductase selenoprotein B family protein [Alkalicoccus saliphilus]|nr:glycine/sarcosine/betaine reductase selenoprotein B family protein [Alkalicoccus saliphilus]